MLTPTNAGDSTAAQTIRPNWKFIGIHSMYIYIVVLAVSEMHNKLLSLVSCVKKNNKTPTITVLTATTVPRGNGQKDCVHPCYRTQVHLETVTIKDFSERSQPREHLQHPHCDIQRNATVARGPIAIQTWLHFHFHHSPPVRSLHLQQLY